MPGTDSPDESVCRELGSYFHISPDEVRGRLKRAKADFAQEWIQANIDPGNEAQVARFYRQNVSEIFELMEWHANTDSQATRRYLSALGAAQVLRPEGTAYLDYGSGVGTGAIMFKLAGFGVALADISESLLNFCRWRFEQRGLDAEFIDLEKQGLPAEIYDVVTCFDVLEHVPDPAVVVAGIRNSLKPGGILILRVSFVLDEDHPMHFKHDPLMPYSFEALGFKYRFDVTSPYLQVLVKDRKSAARSGMFSRTQAEGSKWIAHDAFHVGDYRRAREYFLRSLRHDPFQIGVVARFCMTCLSAPAIGALRRLRRGAR